MKTKLMRTDSRGIEGTYENANHHAMECIPLIDSIVTMLPECSFDEWKQGHNSHKLIAKDGRTLKFHPLVHTYDFETGSWGIRISLVAGKELVTVFDYTCVTQSRALLSFLKSFSESSSENYYLRQKEIKKVS